MNHDETPRRTQTQEQHMTTQPAHKCSFPVQPPKGSWFNPGPCDCGKTYARSQAETLMEEATAAMNATEADDVAADELETVTRERNDALRAQVNGTCCDHGARIGELERERDEARAERDHYRTIARDAVGFIRPVGSSSQAIDQRAIVNHWRKQLGMGPL
jgi:hypothetical protein